LGYARTAYPVDYEIDRQDSLPDERKRKFTDRQILKILILLQIFGISFRSLDMHTINREIAFLYTVESIAAIDSFMIRTCESSTAVRRKARGNYKDPESG